jgi:hypothetical protein
VKEYGMEIDWEGKSDLATRAKEKNAVLYPVSAAEVR